MKAQEKATDVPERVEIAEPARTPRLHSPAIVPRDAGPGERLAIFGGPRAVRKEAKDGWRRIGFREVKAILYSALRDVNTVSDGKGPIERFEKRFAKLCGSKYALVMNSGTATLHSAYFALGIGPGTEVIVPAYTFFATATPLLQLGANPVFCDIDEHTLAADPADVERRITPRTRAIVVVTCGAIPLAWTPFARSPIATSWPSSRTALTPPERATADDRSARGATSAVSAFRA
jgi:hypothetical protein